MATRIWPSKLDRILAAGHSEGVPENVIRTTPSVGPAITRRRSTVAAAPLDFTVRTDTAGVDEFLRWHNETLEDGALDFELEHPRTKKIGTYIINAVGRITPVDGDPTIFDIPLQLQSVP